MMLLTVADVVLRARRRQPDPRHVRAGRAAARLDVLLRAAGGLPARREHRRRHRRRLAAALGPAAEAPLGSTRRGDAGDDRLAIVAAGARRDVLRRRDLGSLAAARSSTGRRCVFGIAAGGGRARDGAQRGNGKCERRPHRRPRRGGAARAHLRARADRDRARRRRVPRLRRARRLAESAEDARQRAVQPVDRVLALGDTALHPDGCGRLACRTCRASCSTRRTRSSRASAARSTHATIGACAAFGAICGSSIATAATFSKVSIPEMRRHGYDPGVLPPGRSASAGHARHHHPAVGDPRDLLDRRRAVVAEAVRRGARSRGSSSPCST